MKKDLVIIGAGGFGREAGLIVEEINKSERPDNQYSLLGYIDEDESKWGQKLRGYPVIGGWPVLGELSDSVELICVIGDPVIKMKICKLAEKEGRRFATLIHPAVDLAEDVRIGKGVLINKGCLFTVNIEIGDHVSINPGCGIGHDAVINAYTTLMWRVNISGNVNIGEGCLLGTGSTVLQGKSIGSGSIIGAGAVVTKDIPDKSTAVGIPARVK